MYYWLASICGTGCNHRLSKMLQPTFILFLDLLVAIISIIYVATELVGDVFNSKQAIHGRVASSVELRCLWAACMQGLKITKPYCLVLLVFFKQRSLKSRTCEDSKSIYP